MAVGVDGEAGLNNSPSGWLRAEDAAILEEDSERNAVQAERNSRMRDLLRSRRADRAGAEADAVVPEAFMAVAKVKVARKPLEEGQPPWFVMRPWMENAVLRLHEELLDFMKFMQHTKEEVAARRQWVNVIATACKSMWPSCQVKVFGSFFTGLSLPNGDVDVAVSGVTCKSTTAMKMLAEHLLAKGEISWLEIIESAKVPVVKVRSQSCGLRADIVFNQPDGIETSRFIKSRLKEFPQMKPILVFLKYFLLQRGLHETYTGGMGSYLLCNVVLHFIQRHPSRKNQRLYAATSLGHLLFDFLKYYGQEFKYDSHGISVIDGGSTFLKAERGFTGNKRGGMSLCLESPLLGNVDLGSACFRMNVLRNLFHHGFHCLCHLFVSRSPPEVSMLCPLLLDPIHPVITSRYKLLAEQPVAMPGLPRAGSQTDIEASQPEETAAPKKKRKRRSSKVAAAVEPMNEVPEVLEVAEEPVQKRPKRRWEKTQEPAEAEELPQEDAAEQLGVNGVVPWDDV